jgi:diguanylate cyclase
MLGLLIGLSDYLLDECFNSGVEEYIVWISNVTLLMFLGYKIGKFIKDMYIKVYRDPLTGLFNRGYFYYRFNNEIEKLDSSKSCLSLAMIDIDNFKDINDFYGHLEGDNAIKYIADVLKQSIRKTDAVIRWGGDEFALILSNTNEMEAYQIADSIRQTIEEQEYNMGNCSCKMTISIGIYTINEKVGQDKFLSLADTALYKAKIEKNSVTVFKL